MSNNNQPTKSGFWSKVDMKAFIPGLICLLLVVAAGIIFPVSFNNVLTNIVNWLMEHFKWFYILCATGLVGLFAFLLCSKAGNIRLGGKKAKPSLKTSTWFTLSMTSTIAVGICFYGVSGPVSIFMDPPAFLGVEGGTPEAIIPALKYCFLHYAFPPFFLMVGFAFMISIMKYNGKRSLRLSDTLYPLIGDRVNGVAGTAINSLQIISLVVCGTNMGLAAIQLNAGIGTVSGMAQTPNYEFIIIVGYTLLTALFACSGVHKLMASLSNVNAIFYFLILLFVLLVGPTNRLINLGLTSVSEFIMDFFPMLTFGDPIYETGWQTTNTMFYYSWNIAPALLHALFYVTISYGRTLKEFIMVNCILPAFVTMGWYTLLGGTAMFGILNGSGLWETIQQFGSGISTFAFLDTLPLGSIMKWVFILVAIMTFITFSDGVAFSFPMLMVKDSAEDASYTKVPRALNVGIALFMGVLTFMLLYVGGYDALNSVMVALAFPAAILMVLVMFSFVKFLRHRDKYDVTYQEEMAEVAQGETVDCEEIPFPADEAADTEIPTAEA